jgi:hypothetical protein
VPEVQRVARYIIVRILQLHQIPTKPDIYHTATHLFSMNKQNRNPTKSVGLIQNGPDHHFMATLTCSRHNIAEQIVELSLSNISVIFIKV